MRPREAWKGAPGGGGGGLSRLTFSKAMRACVSYTSTVNSVRTPCTWGAGRSQARAGQDAAPLLPRSPPRAPAPHRQVLPDGLHLLAGKSVVLLLLPLRLDHAQGLLQNLGRVHRGSLWQAARAGTCRALSSPAGQLGV